MDEQKKISRRKALKYIGAGVVGVAGVYAAVRFTPLNDKLRESLQRGDIRPITARKDKIYGDRISLLAFGCMRFPTMRNHDGTTVIDREKTRALLEYAYANGINYFDTAYNYHHGESEIITGEILKNFPRDTFCLATKMPTWLVTSLERGKELFREQLNKCQVEYFDFYLLHALSSIDDYNRAYRDTGVLEYLKEEKANGRIRRLGFSFHGNEETMDYLLEQYPWDFVMIQMNYLDWEVQNAKYMYEQIEKKGIQCLVMEPLRGGALATLNTEAARILKEADPSGTPARWAFRYVASFPNVLTVLSGMNRLDHLEENINTFRKFKPLKKAEYDVIARALEAYRKISQIPCTACAYCMPCPYGVDIPLVFSTYNRMVAQDMVPDINGPRNEEFFAKGQAFLSHYTKSVPFENQSQHCTACGVCKQHCPQEIDIPAEMKKINEILRALNGRS
ncbi:MAG: aldo/keto reductase [Bacteroidales bacterium]|jgi:predicted aldo/keto reductase-like oxidoreductase|nr:aldo/keto reductase [Bacteroidales bacterium]MDD3208125.1 aldo/keto reductase [Bacteroidales bacterium]MDD3696833.1 aldo/keto reductase [Bacteroidales bacterium]MDD4167134.1 aldo/keto reductase [Bacteroidales bacterium]MDD5046284.1 aldo/keto reductase [Bacteroidales bacterium]